MSETKNRKSKGLLLIVKTIKESQTPVSVNTLRKILEYNDVNITLRTFQRYIKELIDGFYISDYNYSENGYILNDLVDKDELDLFMSLLQVQITNELAMSSVKKLRGKKSYIVTDTKNTFKGNEWIEQIIVAIESQKQIKFKYHTRFQIEATERTVFPRLLKEYQNRWYLIAEDKKKDDAVRIFGLDRIENLQLANKQKYIEEVDYKSLFENVIGLDTRSCHKEYNEAIEVIFKANAHQKNYFKSLPFHHNQALLSETENEAIFKVFIFPNYEFKQHIFHYTPFVEVLEPKWLREQIKSDLQFLLSKYEK